MTLIATRRYVASRTVGCLGTAKVVRRARPRVTKPGKRSRRPVAFLITVISDAGASGGTDADGNQSQPAAAAPARPRPAAYDRPFRICRGCGLPAPRESLVNGDGDRPRHPQCMPPEDTHAEPDSSDLPGDSDA
ncbi:MAG TPA: hypothetical protein VGL36_35485 [Kribbella sp.]